MTLTASLPVAKQTTFYQPADPLYVDARQAADVRYWAEQFQFSGAQLRASVAMVGNEALRVQVHLTSQRYGAAFPDAGPSNPATCASASAPRSRCVTGPGPWAAPPMTCARPCSPSAP